MGSGSRYLQDKNQKKEADNASYVSSFFCYKASDINISPASRKFNRRKASFLSAIFRRVIMYDVTWHKLLYSHIHIVRINVKKTCPVTNTVL